MSTNSSTTKFGVIGLGNIAFHHIKSIQEIEGCELVAVTSSSEEKRLNAQKEYNVEAYSNYQDMFKNVNLDFVCICTPSGYHLEPALAAASNGVHVICEKPLEVTMDRGSKMVEACEKNNVYLGCIFQNRYSQDFQKIIETLETGVLGKLLLGNAYIKWFRDQDYYNNSNWRGTIEGDGGAALINQGIHTVDLLIRAIGPVKSVFAKTKTVTHDIEGEDLATAIVEFENGAIGTIECSTSIYEGFPEKLEIHGSDGSIVLESGKIQHWNIKGSSEKAAIDVNQQASGSSDPMAISYLLHKQQIEEIVEAVNNKKPLRIDGKEALKSIQLIEAIYKSAKTGKEVFL